MSIFFLVRAFLGLQVLHHSHKAAAAAGTWKSMVFLAARLHPPAPRAERCFRRFVNLVSTDSMKSVYTLRHIDVSRLFLPTPSSIANSRTPLPPPMKDGCCLPEPTINFYASQLRSDCGGMEFMLFDNKVVDTDTTGGAFIYDPDRQAVCPLPSRAKLRRYVESYAVGNNLYVIDRNGGGARTFEALVYTPSLHGRWHWRALRPPPQPPGVRDGADDPTSIESCAAVAGGSRIWVSARGYGDVKSCTHLFDAEKLAWSEQPADWALPFHGGTEHVPELNKLWFGISSREHGRVFCASDLAGASATRPPVLHAALDGMATAPEEWRLLSARAVHLGSGKFFVARIFCICTRSSKEGHVGIDVMKQFAVLAGVEVLGSRDGGEISMVQHNSERYMLCDDDELHWVL